ncbi:hypothetical protein ACFV1B_11870 [Streptomyces sp. NPDC059637]|uniref:hypothetical protein n=1 Tax=Streptomyces sp. NPDC059637 TaxID=3347752 RepID=UPI00368F6259
MEPRGERRRTVLRRAAIGAGLAVTCTAAMLAVTVPLNAAGQDGTAGAASTGRPGRADGPGRAASADGAPGTDGASRADDAPGVVEEPAPPAETGTGRDALTPDEIEAARDLALARDRGLRTAAEDVRGKDGDAQYLSTALARPSGDGGTGGDGHRRAEVYFYDYSDDTLVKKTVDLTEHEVVASERNGNAQPPPSRAEAAEAVGVLLDSPLGAGLKEDYRAATGRTLARATQLDTRGLTYRAPEGVTGPAAKCGEHRCVRLFTRVADGPWIDVRHLVVDLSARTALRLP